MSWIQDLLQQGFVFVDDAFDRRNILQKLFNLTTIYGFHFHISNVMQSTLYHKLLYDIFTFCNLSRKIFVLAGCVIKRWKKKMYFAGHHYSEKYLWRE